MIGRYFDKRADENIQEVELEFNKKYGMLIRPGHSDLMTLKECYKDYPNVNVKGKIVLDIGAHIGGFSKIAIDQGAKRVVSFEPDLFNYEVLEQNVKDKRVTIINGAIVSSDDSHVTLWSNGSQRSSASASINKLRGAVSEQKVKAYNFNKVLHKCKPQIIKMDIEGGEYPLLIGYDIPDFVEEIVIEMHGFRKAQKPLMKELRERFQREWNIVHEDEQKVFGGISLVTAHYSRNPIDKHKNIGDSFDSFLESENIKEPIDKKIKKDAIKPTKKEILYDHKPEYLSYNSMPEYPIGGKPALSYNDSCLSNEVNSLCHKHFDQDIGKDFRMFILKVNERIEWQYGLRETYEAPKNLPALGPDVEYFGFHLLMDDRMRYIAQNLVAIPDSKLSPANKICNTLISHFYGARGIHQTITKIEDPLEAHIDFERMLVDNDYRLQLRQNLIEAKENNIPIYGSTELRTSLFGASNKHITEKYEYAERNTEPGNILEWVADFITDGTIDKILKTDSLQGMFKILTAKGGIGNYYGYHGSTSNSVNPNLPFDHDERFVVPGPGSSKTARLMFPGLSEKQVSLGDRVIWVRENQKWILEGLKIHEFFYNLPDYKGDNIFPEDIKELKSYTAEVGMCQYGIFRRLRENPHLASRRKVSRADDNIEKKEEQCAIEIKEEKKSSVALDLISGNLTANEGSHKAAWAYLLANQFYTKYGKTVDVLHKGASWDGYKTILLYNGMEFSGSLNLFGGAKEESAKKIERIIKHDARMISLDIPMPDYGELCRNRLKNCDEYWSNVDWDAVSEKCKLIKSIKHINVTDRLVMGDSHAFSVYEPGQMVIRYDHKTMHGANQCGIKNIVKDYGIDIETIRQLTLYFGNIDVRHHLARQTNIKKSIQTLVQKYVKNILSVGIKDIELVELLPIEDESRKIPKSGWYEGSGFYGSWKVRNNIRNYMNHLLEKACKQFSWKFYKHSKDIYTEDGKLSFDAMERPRNVHLSPKYYRWNLRENKRNF